MVTVITASGSPILLPTAHDARMLDGRLVCLDAAGNRLLSFDPIDVRAFAVEAHGREPVWVMGGLDLALTAEESSPDRRPIWRLPGRLRLSYR